MCLAKRYISQFPLQLRNGISKKAVHRTVAFSPLLFPFSSCFLLRNTDIITVTLNKYFVPPYDPQDRKHTVRMKGQKNRRNQNPLCHWCHCGAITTRLPTSVLLSKKWHCISFNVLFMFSVTKSQTQQKRCETSIGTHK